MSNASPAVPVSTARSPQTAPPTSSTSATEYLTVDQWLTRFPVVGRSKLYELLRTGELPSFRVGRRILIPSTALDQIATAAGAMPGERGAA